MSDKNALNCPICQSSFFNIFPAGECQTCHIVACGHCMIHDHPDHEESICQQCMFKATPRGQLSEMIVDDLIELLLNQESEKSAMAAMVLAEKNDNRSVKALISALKDSRGSVRRESAKALGILQDNDAIPNLIDALGDQDPSVRSSCINALAAMEVKDSLNMIEQFINDSSRQVAGHAIHALAAIQKNDSVPLLKQVINSHEVAYIRCEALLALSRLDKKLGLEAAVTCLSSPDKTIQISACKIIARINDPKGIDPLQQLIDKKPPVSVRMTAQSSINKITSNSE